MGKGMPIALVVDDEESVRRLFVATLELDGWVAAEAVDGADAIRVLQTVVPDIVLVDMMMPNVDGMGVLQAMAEDPRLAAVPRVVVSAKEDPMLRRFALQLGAVAWLVKPVTPERLLAAAWDHHSDPEPQSSEQT